MTSAIAIFFDCDPIVVNINFSFDIQLKPPADWSVGRERLHASRCRVGPSLRLLGRTLSDALCLIYFHDSALMDSDHDGAVTDAPECLGYLPQQFLLARG
jgi:hypothetical protein